MVEHTTDVCHELLALLVPCMCGFVHVLMCACVDACMCDRTHQTTKTVAQKGAPLSVGMQSAPKNSHWE